MSFPTWVQKKNRNAKMQASARLRYMLYRLAIDYTDKPTIRALCIASGAGKHSTVSLYVAQGAFSQALAERFEKFFGAEHITAAALMDPLSVEPAYNAKTKK